MGKIQKVNQSDFAFTCWLITLAPFHTLIDYLYIFLCEGFNVQIAHLKKFCSGSLYMLDANPLSGICFAYVSSQSVACLFIFCMMAFDEHWFFILLKSNLQTFLVYGTAFYVLRNFCQSPSCEDICLNFI